MRYLEEVMFSRVKLTNEEIIESKDPNMIENLFSYLEEDLKKYAMTNGYNLDPATIDIHYISRENYTESYRVIVVLIAPKDYKIKKEQYLL